MRARIIAVVVLVAVVAGGAWWWHRDEAGGADSATLTLHGNIDIRQINLAFNGSERIDSMAVQEGDRVHKGEQLARLDTDLLRHRIDQLQSQVAAQAQTVAKLHAGSRPQEIAQARADLAAAEAQARNAERTAKRQANLVTRHLTSREQADNARTAAQAARAKVRAAKAGLALLLEGPRKEDIAAAEDTLRAYRAQLDEAKQQLTDATLIAPADGVVENRLLQPGDMASPQNPVYTIALDNPLWVRAYVDEPDLGKIRPGMSAAVTTDSYPGKHYRGWIGFISPTAEFTPKSVETREVRTDLVYQVRVMVCNPQGQLRLGMPATVSIDLNQKAPAGKAAEHCGG